MAAVPSPMPRLPPSSPCLQPEGPPGELPKSSFPALGELEEDQVVFAVPKKGRLASEVMKVMEGAGLNAKRPERVDVAICTELNVKLVFLPAADIASYILDGNVDIGITGSDMLQESILETPEDGSQHIADVRTVLEFPFGHCRLCLQAPASVCQSVKPEDFCGKRIVTSFPNLSKRYFEQLAASKAEGASPRDTRIKVVSGSVEAAVGLGLADGIVDLVETGTTMRAAGLDVVSDVIKSQAVLLQQVPRGREVPAAKAELLALIERRIQGYLTATSYVMVVYNCIEANLEECCKITPGKRSPTVNSLQEPGWYAVTSLVQKKSINTVMDNLTLKGAVDILVVDVKNTRM